MPADKKKVNRRTRDWTDDSGGLVGIIVEESTAYTPMGHVKRKWDAQRVFLTREELAALAAKYPVGGGA